MRFGIGIGIGIRRGLGREREGGKRIESWNERQEGCIEVYTVSKKRSKLIVQFTKR